MTGKIEFFEERIVRLNEKVKALNARYNRYSIYRISVFAVFLISLIWSLNAQQLTIVLLLSTAFVIVFVLLVKKHNRISAEQSLNQKLLAVNEEEKSRLLFDFEKIENGAEFINDHHPYTSDLDVFGRNSLFQLLNRAGTSRGINLMKTWLENPCAKDEILSRQKAAFELSAAVEWRQYLQAHARQRKTAKGNNHAFFQWLQKPDLINNSMAYRVVPYVMIVITLGIVIGIVGGYLSFYYLILPLTINGYFLLRILDYSRETYQMTESGLHMLESIENMLLLIERRQFENSRLKLLQTKLGTERTPASARIRKLRKIFSWLSQRGNQMYQIFNSVFLMDFLLLAKAERWRSREKNEVEQWFDSVAEFEALSSIGGFAFAHEDFVFPQIADKGYSLESRQLGHPLIPTDQRVCNDFKLENRGSISLITGSNMSGKSTFLRTVGINAVLAFCGAPVCAQSLELSLFRIFASMRTRDNLEESISSFYAELLRLKMLLDHISDDLPTLFLLDEILKGTNSVDRHRGAASLVLQLNELNAFGLVSTHDLELGRLQEENKKIKNYNFSSSIVGEEIVFDYKLREGICESTNASQLMVKMGINIKS